jgi:transposase
MRLGTSGGSVAAPDFVPIVSAVPAFAPEPAPLPPSPAPLIEVKPSGAVLRIPPSVDADLLTTVLRAIRASAT